MGKILFYFFVDGIEKGYKYITAKKDTKNDIIDILKKMASTDSFIKDVSKLVNTEDGLSKSEVEKIVKNQFVQNQIKDKISKNQYVKKEDLENGITDVILKSWNDKSITNAAIQKVEKDIK